MYVDNQQKMSDSQAVTATAASTNIIDLGTGGIGDTPQDVVVAVTEAATAAGAATLTITVEVANEVAFDTTNEVIATTAAIGKADLTLARELIRLPVNHITKRYLRVKYTVATGPLTAGEFDAVLVNAAQTNA